jgi:hypothetical protein
VIELDPRIDTGDHDSLTQRAELAPNIRRMDSRYTPFNRLNGGLLRPLGRLRQLPYLVRPD